MPTPPFWFFPIVFPSADSTNSVLLPWPRFRYFFLGPLVQQYLAIMVIRSGAKLRWYCFIDDGYFNSFHLFCAKLCRFGQGVGLGGEWGGAVVSYRERSA
jgi:hypothetical protein